MRIQDIGTGRKSNINHIGKLKHGDSIESEEKVKKKPCITGFRLQPRGD
jgi:hypothetical protein